MNKFITKYIFGISMVSALGSLLFGYDWVVIGGAKPFYEQFFHITGSTNLQGWAMSSALLGCLLGSVISGILSYRFWRKRLLIFYQGLGLKKLNKHDEAKQKFNNLLKFGKEQINIPFKMDYFAVSLPDLLIFEEDMQKRHETECHYLIGLGYLGLEENKNAADEFSKVLQANLFHQGASVHMKLIDNGG